MYATNMAITRRVVRSGGPQVQVTFENQGKQVQVEASSLRMYRWAEEIRKACLAAMPELAEMLETE
jgi:hypothetical protein